MRKKKIHLVAENGRQHSAVSNKENARRSRIKRYVLKKSFFARSSQKSGFPYFLAGNVGFGYNVDIFEI